MRIFIIILMSSFVLLLGCGSNSSKVNLGEGIQRWHDDEFNVTCWVYKSGYSGGLSCIPDSELDK